MVQLVNLILVYGIFLAPPFSARSRCKMGLTGKVAPIVLGSTLFLGVVGFLNRKRFLLDADKEASRAANVDYDTSERFRSEVTSILFSTRLERINQNMHAHFYLKMNN